MSYLESPTPGIKTKKSTEDIAEKQPKQTRLTENKARKVARSYMKFTPTKRNKFLRALEKMGNITSAAAYVGVSRATIYNAMKTMPKFKEKVEIAQGKATYKFEEEAEKRAMGRYDEAVYFQGEEVGRKRVFSDRLLEKLMEANDPARYGKHSNMNIEQNVTVSQDSAKDKLAALLKVEGYLEGEFEEVSSEEDLEEDSEQE